MKASRTVNTLLLCALLTASTTSACDKKQSSDTAPPSRTAEAPPSTATDRASTYLDRRRAFKTQLVRNAPAPQQYDKEPVPAGVREVVFTSGQLTLKAWVANAPPDTGKRAPALVYFHGGFSFGVADLKACRPFLDAGFVVMTPMLRGENGNPGSFELFLGEVDDGAAAIRWLAKQDYVDPKRVFAFGHSAGGAISALVSLLDNVPVVHTGSAGGIFSNAIFDDLRSSVPFDLKRSEERAMRLLLGNVVDMKRTHYGYVAIDDGYDEVHTLAKKEAQGKPTKLQLMRLDGDHFTSLPVAMKRYLGCAQSGRCP